MEQVSHNCCLKKLEALAFDVDNVLDEFNKIEINNNKVRSCEMALASAKLLLGKVASFPITTELALLWNLEGELKNLRRSAKTIKSFLDDVAEMNGIKSTRDWVQDLEAAALDAGYVFEELSYQLVRSKVQEMKESNSYYTTGCADFLSSILNNLIIKRHTVATKVKDISQRLKALYEMRNGLNLPMRLRSSHASGGGGGGGGGGPASTQTPSYDVKYGAFGRENDVRMLADMVCSPAATEQRVSVLPIVGMGGMGKTALAERVYNDERIVSHFGERIWVTVSEYFNVDALFNNLLASLLMPGENHTPGFFQRREVLRRIREKLMHKTYLLVLDDVWNELPFVWDDFIIALEEASFGKGNVVLITTRKQKAVDPLIMNPPPLCVYNLGLLSNEDCWFIIKAVINFNAAPDSELEAIGKSIAARCGGLPLAAHVVARWLRGRSKDEWTSIERSRISDLDYSISTILKRSFDNLSSTALKKCFAYCSIIPKGSCIDKENLIELWMAEGLLQADKKSDMEGDGNNILNDLVHSLLIQVLERDSLTGDAKKVGMHTLVVDLELSLLQPDLLDQEDHQCRYIFSESTHHFQIEKHADHLCALFCYSKLTDKMLSRMKRLHTLILNGEDITELPVSIGKLIHMKYLNIANTRIETLPESIGDLHLFQTLRATVQHGEKSYLRELPVSFKYLLSLRHLHIPNIELPPGVGNLTSLRTLPYFCVIDEEGRRIAELGKLTNLTGELEIDNLGKVRDKEEAESANLIINPNIYMLKLAWKNEGGQSSNDDNNVMEGLQPHPNLKILEISGFKGESLPEWLGSLPSLQLLRISECPLLTKALESEPRNLNPEWSKISHIPCIQLDYNQIT